ncbi:MAG: VOC family protein [Burkholderiaceae bacterium]
MKHAEPDHLVIAAASLDEGVAWCEATLGVTPGPGGEHALFGTHNRLLRLDSPHTPNVYLEIIAINRAKVPSRGAPAKRWFDLDDARLHDSLKRHGPQAIHWVARVPHLPEALSAWRALGLDSGEPLAASRPTPDGLLQWHISVREDGQRLLDGCLPTLIEWGNTHPAATMPSSGLRLTRVEVFHPQATLLATAFAAIGLDGASVCRGPAQLRFELITPNGTITLTTHSIDT